ncbi:MAG: hypothetical protein ABI843_01490 [Dokdonella sp.]
MAAIAAFALGAPQWFGLHEASTVGPSLLTHGLLLVLSLLNIAGSLPLWILGAVFA